MARTQGSTQQKKQLPKEYLELRNICEKSLVSFAKTMFPDRYYGDMHQELFNWWQDGSSDCQLALIPRDHQKSHCLMVYAAWKLTTDPSYTFVYVSANPRLAKKQLASIVQIFRSDTHRMLWPDFLNYEKGRTGRYEHKPLGVWTQEEIEVDHPARREKAIRDPSVYATSVKSTNTGFHFHEVLFDDLVTDENYDSEAEKQDVIDCYKNFAKIATTDSRMKAVGTRYGLDDLYSLLKAMDFETFNNKGERTGVKKMWDVFERVVEDSPRRTGDGEFVWPRMTMPNGVSYGFDAQQLAIKKAQLGIDGDMMSYYSQYYNDPNDSSLQTLTHDMFLYIDQRFLREENGKWYYKDKYLQLTAAVDLAFTEGGGKNLRRRDYTAICVIGKDADGYVYVLDIDRFQTDKIEVYYEHIAKLHEFWGFREIFIETNNGGKIVKPAIEDLIRKQGSVLVVHGVSHTSHQGKKEERIAQALEPLYRQRTIYHVKMRLIKLLEEELILPRPPHDDMKDCLALAVINSKKPMTRATQKVTLETRNGPISRFGGVRGSRRGDNAFA
jgi:predicted phage terminase large subunit-like protein